jgi:hypothetical protein
MRSKYIVAAVALSVGVVSSAWSADEPAQPATAPAAQHNSEADAQEKRLLAEGYKKKTRSGQTVYCRKEIPLGSRFEKEYCGSAQDITLQEQRARDLMNGNKTTGAGSK